MPGVISYINTLAATVALIAILTTIGVYAARWYEVAVVINAYQEIANYVAEQVLQLNTFATEKCGSQGVPEELSDLYDNLDARGLPRPSLHDLYQNATESYRVIRVTCVIDVPPRVAGRRAYFIYFDDFDGDGVYEVVVHDSGENLWGATSLRGLEQDSILGRDVSGVVSSTTSRVLLTCEVVAIKKVEVVWYGYRETLRFRTPFYVKVFKLG